MSFKKISSKIEAKIAEIAAENNISRNLTKEITAKVLEIVKNEQKEFEGEITELEGYIRCLEANFERLERMMNVQVERYGKLLEEKEIARLKKELIETRLVPLKANSTGSIYSSSS